MDYKTIIVEEKDMIGRITFNRLPLNVLNIEMMKENDDEQRKRAAELAKLQRDGEDE